VTILVEALTELHEARVMSLALSEYFRSFVYALNRTTNSGGELRSDEVCSSSNTLTTETTTEERYSDSDVLQRHLENLCNLLVSIMRNLAGSPQMELILMYIEVSESCLWFDEGLMILAGIEFAFYYYAAISFSFSEDRINITVFLSTLVSNVARLIFVDKDTGFVCKFFRFTSICDNREELIFYVDQVESLLCDFFS
jgi:hypothetical protein